MCIKKLLKKKLIAGERENIEFDPFHLTYGKLPNLASKHFI